MPASTKLQYPLLLLLGCSVMPGSGLAAPVVANAFPGACLSSIPVPASATAPASTRTLFLSNLGADLQSGEPRQGGKMKATVWANFSTTAKSRVVVHTVGSFSDTVLAAHTGAKVNDLKRVASNDDFALPGGTDPSLVRFDAAADKRYSLQLGDRDGDFDLSFLHISVFKPGGGLSAFMVDAGPSGSPGSAYFCAPTQFSACTPPRFVLHNSTNKQLRITTTTDLEGGLVPPSPFNLPAGAMRTVDFTDGAAFDVSTPRTIIGSVDFTARSGGELVSRAKVPGIVVVKGNGDPPNALSAEVSFQARAGCVHDRLSFELALVNEGLAEAEGCYIATAPNVPIRTTFQRINPDTGETIGAANRPTDIPGGQQRIFRVTQERQDLEVAEPISAANVRVDCATTDPLTLDLKNRFDVSAAIRRPADIVASAISPSNGIVDVPPTGTTTFRVAAVNRGAEKVVTARPEFHSEPDPDRQYSLKICRLESEFGGCRAPPAASVSYRAAKGATHFFRVVVGAPDEDPGFDPPSKRVFVMFEHDPPVGLLPVLVGADSLPVRVQE